MTHTTKKTKPETKKVDDFSETPTKIWTERNKKVWLLVTPEGKVVGRFRSLIVARQEKKRREDLYWGVDLSLERDMSYRWSKK